MTRHSLRWELIFAFCRKFKSLESLRAAWEKFQWYIYRDNILLYISTRLGEDWMSLWHKRVKKSVRNGHLWAYFNFFKPHDIVPKPIDPKLSSYL